MKVKLFLFLFILSFLFSGCETMKVVQRAFEGELKQTPMEELTDTKLEGPIGDVKNTWDVLKYDPHQFERSWEIW